MITGTVCFQRRLTVITKFVKTLRVINGSRSLVVALRAEEDLINHYLESGLPEPLPEEMMKERRALLPRQPGSIATTFHRS